MRSLFIGHIWLLSFCQVRYFGCKKLFCFVNLEIELYCLLFGAPRHGNVHDFTKQSRKLILRGKITWHEREAASLSEEKPCSLH